MLHITACLENAEAVLIAKVTTNDSTKSLQLPAKPASTGSAINGELLMLAVATCYCNDIYREAAQRGIKVTAVQVDVSAQFDSMPGSVAQDIGYSATVSAHAAQEAILDLMYHTDTVAEIHNTLRKGTAVQLVSATAISMDDAASPTSQ